MSMIGNLVAITPEQLTLLIANPGQIESFLYPDNGETDLPNHLDLDKAWHAIHFILNGDSWGGEEPLSLAILGGEAIGDDLGYGPARYLTPSQVTAVADALAKVPPEVFCNRFNAAALAEAEIYPQVWKREGEEGLNFVQPHYIQLSAFYQASAQGGKAALLFLN